MENTVTELCKDPVRYSRVRVAIIQMGTNPIILGMLAKGEKHIQIRKFNIVQRTSKTLFIFKNILNVEPANEKYELFKAHKKCVLVK